MVALPPLVMAREGVGLVVVTFAFDTADRLARLEGVLPDTLALDLAARLERSALEVTLAIGDRGNVDAESGASAQDTGLGSQDVTHCVVFAIAGCHQGADGHDAACHGDVCFGAP